MGKRGNGEGNVYERANGTWEARISFIDPQTGKRKRASFYGATAKEARAKLKAAQGRLDAGAPVKDASRTVADWLTHWCKTSLAVSDRKDSTKALYATLSRKHLQAGLFGGMTLDRLKPSDVEGLVLALREKGLAASTIRSTYTVLRGALDGAVRDGLLARNPAALVKRPGVERTEAKHIGAQDATALLNAARASRYHSALVLIAATGLRRGEALALRWDHLDLDKGTLAVRGTLGRVNGALRVTEPKTARSRRSVPLAVPVVAVLRRHRAAQLEERLRAGNQWTETGLVFTAELGTAVDPRNLLRVVAAAAKTAGMTDVGVHTLRHSAAVAWLDAGVHIKAVSDLLGHSSIAITGDVYGHTTDDTAKTAIDGLSAALGL
jgi:integrase